MVKRDFDSSVRTFDNKPNFVRIVSVDGSKITGVYKTDNEVYGFLNYGTKGHMVMPKNGRALRFRANYKSKTRPGSIKASGGGASGSYVFSKGHYVKGIEARRFDEQIKEKREKDFVRLMKSALRDASD